MPSRRALANAVRALSMDAVQLARSGHPGAPLGLADTTEVLWNDFLRHNPNNPKWPDRDRFVLSNGHGSMLLYSLLHLSGYALSIEDLKQFRRIGGKTPGHPEYGDTPGVETTTGPLGQGLANAVGLALAERLLAHTFNRAGHCIVNHRTYVIVGDGCLMEGISHEACSLAGTLSLGKLIVLYDDNGISIDGQVDGWFSDDTPERFRAYGWQVIPAIDGHDHAAVNAALEQARLEDGKPSLICLKTIIGYGAPTKQGSCDCHGAPLGDDEVAKTREALAWHHPPFAIPDEIYAGWDARARGQSLEAEWQTRFDTYREAYPELASEFERRIKGELPTSWDAAREALAQQGRDEKAIASRTASQIAINNIAPQLPELVGGSSDLSGSNLTRWKDCQDISNHGGGNYINYGVREFAMTAIQNGIALHGGFIPFGGTFLVFSDYARNAVRMAALMGLRNIFVYTHDSIGLGEDGPTHQAIEHASSLRLIPDLEVWRPCDSAETAIAWREAIEHDGGPSALLLSRQNLDPQARSEQQCADIARGGYVLLDCGETIDAIVIATGSEVGISMQAARELNSAGRRIRVVSMPSICRFEAQDRAYRDRVLPPSVTWRFAVEAGTSALWYKYVGLDGEVIGIDSFGESGPGPEVMQHFGFTTQHIVDKIAARL